MQLRQLEYLVAVADEGGITRAAERLRTAQPGVSAQLRKLEHELGHQLLDRGGHHVELTDAGVEVTEAARRALAAVADVRHAADALTGLLRGRVRVGAVTSGPFLDLPDALAGFRAEHPHVEVTLTAGGSTEVLAALRAGRLDVGLAGVVGPDPDGLHVHTITEETLVLATTPDSALATAESVELAELPGFELVALAEGNAFRDALDRACAAVGAAPRIAFEASDPSVVASLVGRGLGPAVLPDSLGAFRDGELVAVPLTGPVPRCRLALAWSRERPRGPAARALTTHLVDEALSRRAG